MYLRKDGFTLRMLAFVPLVNQPLESKQKAAEFFRTEWIVAGRA